MIDGVLAAVMDRLKALNLIRHRCLSNAAENCSNSDKTGFFSQCPGSRKCHSDGCLQTLQQYHPRCAIKCSFWKKNDWRGCCGCLKNAQCAVARLESSAHPATAQSGTDSDKRGLVLLQTAFHGLLDLLPAKRRSVSIALLNFYLSSWIISLMVPPPTTPLQHLLSASLPHLPHLYKVCLSTEFSGRCGERFAWWGESGHPRCFLPRQADALCTRDALPSISPTNQCNVCSVFSITVILAGEKITVKRKRNRTLSVLLPWNNNGTCTAKQSHSLNNVWQL